MLFPVTFSRAFVLPCQCSVYAAKRFRTDQSAYCRMRGTLESCSQWKEYNISRLFMQTSYFASDSLFVNCFVALSYVTESGTPGRSAK